MSKNNFLEKIGLLVSVLLIATGQFSFASARTEKKAIVPENTNHWRYEEYEAVIKLNCSNCLDSIAEKHNLYLSPLGGEENENFYLAKSLLRESAKKLIKELGKDRDIELVQPNFKYRQSGSSRKRHLLF